MMTSLPIHLSNHSPQALERNLSGRCNQQRKKENDQQRKSPRQRHDETEGIIRKEVKGFFEEAKERKKKMGRAGGQKNEGRKERLKAFIDNKETKRIRKPPLKTDYEHSVDKSYAKKRQRGSPNSYIEQIPASTSGTATTNKNKEIPTSGTATPDKNKEIPASTSGTATNIEQIPASTTHQTNLFEGISPQVQKAIEVMSEDALAELVTFYEQTKMPVGGLIGLEDLPADKNQEFRWCFELGKPLVKPELANKLPTKMRRFHDSYLKKSAEGLEMFGMLVRPGDFALQNEKVVWLQFADVYEI
jgi:hypothetical protein